SHPSPASRSSTAYSNSITSAPVPKGVGFLEGPELLCVEYLSYSVLWREYMTHYKLEDVFKLSGVPGVTFVEPVEYTRLLVSLRTAGRGVVIEGPSGIGKTSAVAKALSHLGPEWERETLRLSARKAA